MRMRLELQDVKFRDGDAIAYVSISAFFNDPFQQTLFPGMSFDNQVAGIKSRWPRNCGDMSAHYKKVVDTETGEVVSYSKWGFSSTNSGGELKRPSVRECARRLGLPLIIFLRKTSRNECPRGHPQPRWA